jgi:hypothetical protein
VPAQFSEQQMGSAKHVIPFDLHEQRPSTQSWEQQSLLSVQASFPLRQHRRASDPSSKIWHDNPLFLQHLRLPPWVQLCPSLRHRFLFFFASASSDPTSCRPSREPMAPPAANPKRRRVQASNRDPSMGAS